MKQLVFEWDSKKDKSNTSKHSVSFEEARRVFYDEHAIQFYDPDHSEDEDRFIMLGKSFKFRTLVVCHCFRVDKLSLESFLQEKRIMTKNKYIGVKEDEKTLRFF